MAWLHTPIMVGGLYLCWMGYQTLRGALKKRLFLPCFTSRTGEKRAQFLKGLLTNLANPKAIIYFGLVFSLFVGDTSAPSAGHFRVDYYRNTGVVYRRCQPVCPPQMRRGYQRLAKWIDGFAGRYFAGFGIHLTTRANARRVTAISR